MKGKFGIMKYKNQCPILVLLAAILILCICVQPALSEGHKQHKAHVHGVAHLNIALEHNALYMEFISPAADIVGFEHTPETEKEKSAMQKALGKLRSGKRMFEFPEDAGVRLEKAVVKTGLQHECDHDHETHDSAHHDHGENAHETHSDVSIAYQFHCETPGKLKFIGVKLFKYFTAHNFCTNFFTWKVHPGKTASEVCILFVCDQACPSMVRPA